MRILSAEQAFGNVLYATSSIAQHLQLCREPALLPVGFGSRHHGSSRASPSAASKCSSCSMLTLDGCKSVSRQSITSCQFCPLPSDACLCLRLCLLFLLHCLLPVTLVLPLHSFLIYKLNNVLQDLGSYHVHLA